MVDAAAAPGFRKIVVVEDDPETREIELFLLTAEGYEVVGVGEGDTAAETIKREAPALVVLDLMLPGKDGITVLKELAQDPATAATPVVVVSAYADHRSTKERLRGAKQVKRVLDKPFDVTLLLDAVAQEIEASMRKT
jgi:CheY-like chemotaxis protein